MTNARGVFEQPIAEYVAGLVIAMAKDFHGTWELQRQRRWQHRETHAAGRHPGRCRGRRADRPGHRPDPGRTRRHGRPGRPAHATTPSSAGVRGGDELPELLPGADWVVCAAPLTDAHPRHVRRGDLRPDEAAAPGSSTSAAGPWSSRRT